MTTAKPSEDTSLFVLNEVFNQETGKFEYNKKPIDAITVQMERKSREVIQKSFSPKIAKSISTFLLPVVSDAVVTGTEAERNAVIQETQSRVLEQHHIGQFDGYYRSEQILVPPVDPGALVLLTQSLGIFEPLIDVMKNNVDGFGWTFEETMQFDSEEDQKTLRDHLEGDLIQRLETDGIIRIVEKAGGNVREFVKSGDPDPNFDDVQVSFVNDALDTLPLMKSEKMDEVGLHLTTRAWPKALSAFIFNNRDRFEKMRDRDFQAKLESLRREKRDELNKLKSFFDNCNPKESFKKIRKKLRKDFESIGAWAMEVIRDPSSRIPVQLSHVPVVSVRMTLLSNAIHARTALRISDLEIVETDRVTRFRKFVQYVGGQYRMVWFKEFGDDRIIDSKTGRYVGRYVWNRTRRVYERKFYNDENRPTISEIEYFATHPQFEEGNELLYSSFYNASGSPYPLPRWYGNLTLVQGLIANEEVNASTFDNNMVPPYFLLVAGGRLNSQSRQNIENALEEKKRGRDKWNGVVILEAESQNRQRMFAHTGTPAIDIKSMQTDRPTDATHREYDESGQEKMRSTWRFPAAHIGKEKNTNRNTVGASKILAEEQIFRPERDDFDDDMNKTVMIALRINHWKYKSKGPPVADNMEMSQVLERLAKSGLAPVGELRPEIEMILGRQLKKRDDDISRKPLPLVLIEAKAEAAQRSDTSNENPEDKMGWRPEKEGMASASSTLKMNSSILKMDRTVFSKELSLPVGDLYIAPDFTSAILKVQSLISNQEPFVAVRQDDTKVLLFIVGPDGGIGSVYEKRIA